MSDPAIDDGAVLSFLYQADGFVDHYMLGVCTVCLSGEQKVIDVLVIITDITARKLTASGGACPGNCLSGVLISI